MPAAEADHHQVLNINDRSHYSQMIPASGDHHVIWIPEETRKLQLINDIAQGRETTREENRTARYGKLLGTLASYIHCFHVLGHLPIHHQQVRLPAAFPSNIRIWYRRLRGYWGFVWFVGTLYRSQETRHLVAI
ncbi:hypothetical protein COLO4_31177 [Corchorus olitorius]|uniref:Uncharacterized protein n=1 Tax=Corchorus olitorius TaxID=93759 RepID=A0A1R3H595_9ROSI|nr:hypothetical protein COLO4_31177 [Corchorus olitorius]